jgi:predicted nucleic acid-binding protein
MTSYFDTGVFLKLYTNEPESAWAESLVHRRKEPVQITDLHMTETVSALRLKVFRRECQESQASAAIELIKNDLKNGVVRLIEIPWERIWHDCRLLSDLYASSLGVRTLDTLHVTMARHLEAKEFITSDARQAKLARQVGLKVLTPAKGR